MSAMDAYRGALEATRPERVETSGETLAKAALWLDLMASWNEKANLTTIVEPAEAARRHFWEAAPALAYLPEGRLLDVGSGAGFPGLALKILDPTLPVTLLEPRRKRAVFLREAIQACNLEGIEVVQARIEDHEPPPGRYQTFTWRALDLDLHALEGQIGPKGPVRALAWTTVDGGRALEEEDPDRWDTLHWVRLRPSRERVIVVMERIATPAATHG